MRHSRQVTSFYSVGWRSSYPEVWTEMNVTILLIMLIVTFGIAYIGGRDHGRLDVKIKQSEAAQHSEHSIES